MTATLHAFNEDIDWAECKAVDTDTNCASNSSGEATTVDEDRIHLIPAPDCSNRSVTQAVTIYAKAESSAKEIVAVDEIRKHLVLAPGSNTSQESSDGILAEANRSVIKAMTIYTNAESSTEEMAAVDGERKHLILTSDAANVEVIEKSAKSDGIQGEADRSVIQEVTFCTKAGCSTEEIADVDDKTKHQILAPDSNYGEEVLGKSESSDGILEQAERSVIQGAKICTNTGSSTEDMADVDDKGQHMILAPGSNHGEEVTGKSKNSVGLLDETGRSVIQEVSAYTNPERSTEEMAAVDDETKHLILASESNDGQEVFGKSEHLDGILEKAERSVIQEVSICTSAERSAEEMVAVDGKRQYMILVPGSNHGEEFTGKSENSDGTLVEADRSVIQAVTFCTKAKISAEEMAAVGDKRKHLILTPNSNTEEEVTGKAENSDAETVAKSVTIFIEEDGSAEEIAAVDEEKPHLILATDSDNGEDISQTVEKSDVYVEEYSPEADNVSEAVVTVIRRKQFILSSDSDEDSDDSNGNTNSSYVDDSYSEDSDPEILEKQLPNKISALKEKHKERDINIPGIYIRKHRKSYKSSNAQAAVKKEGNTRVYDNYHACFYCGKLLQHLKPHLKTHKHVHEVQELMKQERPDLTELRKKGDHKHNVEVLKNGLGEIILSRRPKESLDIGLFGPCPNCNEWLLLKNLKEHYLKCQTKTKEKITKRQLVIQSQVLSGVISLKPSNMMLQEVFPSMLTDDIGTLAKKDVLIVAMGESWLRRCIDNHEKRRYYTSQHMRLLARLLKELRTAMDDDDIDVSDFSMSDFLRTKYFDRIVDCALRCCLPYMDDVEELQSPSNAIKLKYDLRRIISAKWALLVKKDADSSDAKEMQLLLQLVNLEWGERLIKVARAVMVRRSFTMKKELPSPEDIMTLTAHVVDELKAVELSTENFFRVVQLAQTRILIYNKRRSGEVDAISLENFAGKTNDLDDLDQSLVSDLSKVETYLLKSQEMMMVRGKGHRPVPVLIPPDAVKPLEFLASFAARREADIRSSNKYLFPNKEGKYARSYDSLKKTCAECSLIAPGRITSVSMRKYTATLTQMLNMDPYQIEWMCRHLGHTTEVHKAYYRHMSGFVERVQLSKLFMIQDMNLTSKFKGKKLEEIDISDLLFPEVTPETSADPRQVDLDVSTEIIADCNDDVFENCASETSDDDIVEEEVKKPTLKPCKRQTWDSVEMDEIHKYFKAYLNAKICPRKEAVESAKLKSKQRNGKIWMRSNDKIVKKISAMNHKK